MSSEQQIGSTRTAARSDSGNTQRKSIAPSEHDGSGHLRSRLRFFRMISWFAFYSAAVLFLMSLILFGITHLQTKIFGGALFAAIVLLIAAYVFQWRR